MVKGRAKSSRCCWKREAGAPQTRQRAYGGRKRRQSERAKRDTGLVHFIRKKPQKCAKNFMDETAQRFRRNDSHAEVCSKPSNPADKRARQSVFVDKCKCPILYKDPAIHHDHINIATPAHDQKGIKRPADSVKTPIIHAYSDEVRLHAMG